MNLYTLPNFSFIVLRCPRIFSYFLSDSRNFLKIVAVWFFTYTLFFLHSLISSSFIKITKKFEKFRLFEKKNYFFFFRRAGNGTRTHNPDLGKVVLCQLSYSRFWRRGRDSNPRRLLHPNGFQDRRHKPLGHLSKLHCRTSIERHLHGMHRGSLNFCRSTVLLLCLVTTHEHPNTSLNFSCIHHSVCWNYWIWTSDPRFHGALTRPELMFQRMSSHPKRRGRDSNPRAPYEAAGLANRCIQPLCHPSKLQGSFQFVSHYQWEFWNNCCLNLY